MKKKTIVAFVAGAVTAAVGSAYLIGDQFVNAAMNTDRLKNKGNKTLKKNTQEEQLPEYTLGVRCQNSGQWADDEANYEDVYITNDEFILHSRLYPNDSHDYVIFHYGYTSDITTNGSVIHLLNEHGYNVLAVEPRGHGESGGHYTSMGWYEKDDVVKWIEYINRIDPDAKIVLYGISMGAATVMLTVGEELPDNVVCAVEDCGYSSLWEEYVYQFRSTIHYPMSVLVFGDLVTRIKLGFSYSKINCKKALAQSKTPILMIHGTEDTFVPFNMLQKNYDACASEKEMLVIEGATHARNSSKDPELYWNTFFEFVDRHLDNCQ